MHSHNVLFSSHVLFLPLLSTWTWQLPSPASVEKLLMEGGKSTIVFKHFSAQSSNIPPKVILLINIQIFLILICYIHPLNLYPPCIIFWMRQSCYIHPTIIELYRWKEIYRDKENLGITTGVIVCFSLGGGGGGGAFHDWAGGGGGKKFNWKMYITPLLLFIYYFLI